MNIEDMARFCKKTGMIYPSGEIYGSLAGFWDYGPRGVEIKKAIKDAFWRFFVSRRDDVFGLDGAIITHPKTWYASGHVENFVDPVIVCKKCKAEYRLDHFIEEQLKVNVEGKTLKELVDLMNEGRVMCERCKSKEFERPEVFNLMFKTHIGVKESSKSEVYLRPETAQNIFINFKNVFEIARRKLPFGIAQIGKAFRNEISPRNFLFRCREFEQMEIEYFIHPNDENKCFYLNEVDMEKEVIIFTAEDQINMEEPFIGKWKDVFSIVKDEWHGYWLYKTMEFLVLLGIDEKKIRLRQHLPEELSHYSKETWDIEYEFDFGWKEIVGIANRGDYDLRQHIKHSNKDLSVYDENLKAKIVPYVIEPSFGLDRIFMAVLDSAYSLREGKAVLKLKPFLSPIRVGVFPLVKKDGLDDKAKEVYLLLKQRIEKVFYDDAGSIGKRYARMDEIGTPYCVTIDYQTLEDDSVTIRFRDSAEQERVGIKDLVDRIEELLESESV